MERRAWVGIAGGGRGAGPSVAYTTLSEDVEVTAPAQRANRIKRGGEKDSRSVTEVV